MENIEENIAASNYELVQAYRLAFGSPAGHKVLTDLARFCHAAQTTHSQDLPMALLEGRRQVFLVIQNFLNLTPEELVRVARGLPIRLGGMNE